MTNAAPAAPLAGADVLRPAGVPKPSTPRSFAHPAAEVFLGLRSIPTRLELVCPCLCPAVQFAGDELVRFPTFQWSQAVLAYKSMQSVDGIAFIRIVIGQTQSLCGFKVR